MRGDHKIVQRMKSRLRESGAPNSHGHAQQAATGHWLCPYCGREWIVNGTVTTHSHQGHRRATGFIVAAAHNHASYCADATPEERRAVARLDEVRWSRRAPKQTIRNNHAHPGYGNEPVHPPGGE